MSERWATFDCYGTLVDWNRGIGDALCAMLPGPSRAELLEAYHQIEPRLQAGAATPYREVLARAARAVASRLGREIDDERARALPESLAHWPPFEDVRPALRRLREDGWRLAILSNTDPDLLASSVAAIGVAFDMTVTVADSGSYKPAPGHWETFFERSGADRARHAHVAASPFHDLEPCARLGLRCVWINRLGERSPHPRAAELTDCAGLPSLLDGLVAP